MDKQQIIDALQLIKRLCDGTCSDDCVFSDGEGVCKLLLKCPCNWTINDNSGYWRALL